MSKALEFVPGLVEALGWSVESVNPEGDRLLFTCSGPSDSSLSFWFMPYRENEPAFRTGKSFILGYRDELSPDAQQFLERLATELSLAEAKGVTLEFDSPGAVGEGPSLIYGSDQVEIRVTLACQERCVFCNSWGMAENLAETRADAGRLLRLACDAGARKLVVSGGEPLLVSWVPELIADARELGIEYVTIQTNGVLLGDHRAKAALAAARPDDILVSLHGCTRDVVGDITGKPELFEGKLAGLETTLQAGYTVDLNFVVCRRNLDHVEEFVRYAAALEPRPHQVAFSFVAPSGLAWDNRQEVIPPVSVAAPKLLAALKLAARLKLKVVHSEYCGIPTCVEPGLREFAEPVTDERPMHVPPDKVKLDRCRRCSWDRRCSGIFRRYIEMYGDADFG